MNSIEDIYSYIKSYLLQGHMVIPNNLNLTVTDEQGNTLLHYACSKGDLDVLNFLLDQDIEINTPNTLGELPTLKLFLISRVRIDREVRITMLDRLLQHGAVVSIEQLESLKRDGKLNNLYSYYVNEHMCYEKTDPISGKSEKAFDMDESVQLSFWCETFHQIIDNWESPLIKLHPSRDELVVLHSCGRFSYWKYIPQLTFVRGVKLDHRIGDLTYEPSGKFILINNSKVYELEPFEKPVWLAKLQQYSWNESNESILCFSADGKWGLATYGYNQQDEPVELLAIELKTGKEIRRKWLELGYDLWNTDSTLYPRIHQLHLSNDNSRLTLFHNHADPLISFMDSPMQALEKKDSIDEYLTEGALISQIALSPRYNGLIFYFYSHTFWSDREIDWIGEFVAIDLLNYPTIERWRYRLEAELVGEDVETLKKRYPNGYVSKLQAGEKEVLCTAPNGILLYFDPLTGELLRKVKVQGDMIFAIAPHSTIPNKVRVATIVGVELVDLY